VAEPDPERRRLFASRHRLNPDCCFSDWREALGGRRFADAVMICTQDRDHAAPAIGFAQAGWDILLEKPMAPTSEECRAIVAAVKRAGVVFGVCHVLRYTPYTAALKRLVDDGCIGQVVGIQRLEPVGWCHFAHSYVRGSWRREAHSSSVLMAKCCHDLDWIIYLLGAACVQVSSFADLCHFRSRHLPPGAANRCLDCAVERDCAYSAARLYLGMVARGDLGWPVSALTPTPSEASVRAALRDGPYGRCVYACDNDVPDHQVVILQFHGARFASLTMSAFTPVGHRRTTVFGTTGWLVGNGAKIEHHDFRSDRCQIHEVEGQELRHGGGDDALMATFLEAVARGKPDLLLSGPDESLAGHLLVFAAEQARREQRIVTIGETQTERDG
jgi:predicted dehydrogenase